MQTVPVNAAHTLRLTPRGKEVFLFVKEVLTNKRIAERMGISVSAVKRHKEIMLLQNECHVGAYRQVSRYSRGVP
jgi:DNA-binding CsgD family transcriptional regulator